MSKEILNKLSKDVRDKLRIEFQAEAQRGPRLMDSLDNTTCESLRQAFKDEDPKDAPPTKAEIDSIVKNIM